MILELTKGNLIECGFEVETIEKILYWDNYDAQLFSDKQYFAVQSDKKIYVGIEAVKKSMALNKNYFPIKNVELFIEYYKLNLDAFLQVRKDQLKTLYNELNAIEDFKNEQKELFKAKIQWEQDFIKKMKGRENAERKKSILLYHAYISEILDKTPHQLKNENTGNKQTPPADVINVFCKKMPINIPKKHFKILTEENSKNGEPFLTQDQFDNFISRAFLGKTDIELQKINQGSKEKSKIKYLFYQFYQAYSFEYFKTDQTKDKFIKLLTDNFDGWEIGNVQDNWNKPPKKKF